MLEFFKERIVWYYIESIFWLIVSLVSLHLLNASAIITIIFIFAYIFSVILLHKLNIIVEKLDDIRFNESDA